MTVQELIDLLSSLPEEQKGYKVGCTYDCDCAWTDIQGIRDTELETDQGLYVRLQGG